MWYQDLRFCGPRNAQNPRLKSAPVEWTKRIPSQIVVSWHTSDNLLGLHASSRGKHQDTFTWLRGSVVNTKQMNRLEVYSYLTRYSYGHVGCFRLFTKHLPVTNQLPQNQLAIHESCSEQFRTNPVTEDRLSRIRRRALKEPESNNYCVRQILEIQNSNLKWLPFDIFFHVHYWVFTESMNENFFNIWFCGKLTTTFHPLIDINPYYPLIRVPQMLKAVPNWFGVYSFQRLATVLTHYMQLPI